MSFLTFYFTFSKVALNSEFKYSRASLPSPGKAEERRGAAVSG
jgi:hypothetical protein